MSSQAGNFGFLDPFDQRVARLAEQAEGYVYHDPEACLFKLRLMIETMAKTLTHIRMPRLVSADLGSILVTLEHEGLLSRRDADRMHAIRRDGNAAVHGDPLPHPTAMRRLQDAHHLGAWYARMMKRGVKIHPPEFIPPPTAVEVTGDDHSRAEEIENELDRIRRETREALLIFREDEDIEVLVGRMKSELEGLDRVASEAGEPTVDAEFISLVMAMDLEQVLEHPRYGFKSGEARVEAESQLAMVKSSLDKREHRYLEERRALANKF